MSRRVSSNADSRATAKAIRPFDELVNPRLIELKTIRRLVKPDRSNQPNMIVVECCSFGEPPLLQNINLNLKRSSLTMIVGPVGARKTVLLKGLLGELPTSMGSRYVDTTEVAYCAQTPWLINATIQQNIRGESCPVEEDIVWYQTTLHVCGLESDMAQFPDGDQTVVGSSGFNLSGGQKQRVVR